MVSFEQQMVNQSQLQKLQGQCPDLISESLKYYRRAVEEYESNEIKESAHYIKLAQITWHTAEMRALYLEHRTKMLKVQARKDAAQQLLNQALNKKKELSQLRAKQAQLIQHQAFNQQQQQRSQQTAQAKRVEQALIEARKRRDEAKVLRAHELVPGAYKRAEMALRSAEATVQRSDFVNAERIALGAQRDFLKASEAARPLFEKRKAKQALEDRMMQLLREASQVRNAEAKTEMRGVVMTLNGIYRRGKLTPEGSNILNEAANLVSKYSDLRIIIEGHTTSRGKAEAKLKRSEQMAAQVRDIILRQVAGVKLTVLGRGDYAPITSNPRSAQNERIGIVFFKPRIR
jgi:outer membrane protein OmpA-like peptidoglycan-associated protein